MKLKCILNGAQQPSDYKLFKTTIQTVGSIRKTALLRFSDDNLLVISTPKSFSSGLDNAINTKGSGTAVGNLSSINLSQNEKGQIWCTVPTDVFKLYSIQSIREKNILSMEFSCDSLINVLKRYDKVLNSGSPSDMIIKLQMAPDWIKSIDQGLNNDDKSGDQEANKTNKRKPIVPIYALGITFDEVITTPNEYNPVGAATTTTTEDNDLDLNNNNNNRENIQSINQVLKGSNKTILHHYKVPVRALFRRQDVKIVEPLINVSETPMVLQLPSIQDEYGIAFQNFMKRVERYSMINHLKLQVIDNLAVKDDLKLNILVNEAEWDLKISWKGPLDKIDTGMESLAVEETNGNGPYTNTSSNDNNYNTNYISPNAVSKTQSNPTSLESNNRDNTFMRNLISPLNDQDTQIREEEDLMHIDDSELNMSNVRYVRHPEVPTNDDGPHHDESNVNNNNNTNKTLEEINAMVERAELENNSIHSVMLKIKDWKICSKLYASFDNVLLAIIHDKSCVLHCFLERDFDPGMDSLNNEGSGNSRHTNDNSNKGQIIYYILRSKSVG